MPACGCADILAAQNTGLSVWRQSGGGEGAGQQASHQARRLASQAASQAASWAAIGHARQQARQQARQHARKQARRLAGQSGCKAGSRQGSKQSSKPGDKPGSKPTSEPKWCFRIPLVAARRWAGASQFALWVGVNVQLCFQVGDYRGLLTKPSQCVDPGGVGGLWEE